MDTIAPRIVSRLTVIEEPKEKVSDELTTGIEKPAVRDALWDRQNIPSNPLPSFLTMGVAESGDK